MSSASSTLLAIRIILLCARNTAVHRLLSDVSDELTLVLLISIIEDFGEAGLEQLLTIRSQQHVAAYRAHMDGQDSLAHLFFFFQAEDGIRDLTVTGVQTCALPICNRRCSKWGHSPSQRSARPISCPRYRRWARRPCRSWLPCCWSSSRCSCRRQSA